MNKSLLLAVTIILIAGAFGCASSQTATTAAPASEATTYEKITNTYNSAKELRDNVSAAKEAAKTSGTANTSTKEALKQAVDSATGETRQKAQAEYDAWKNAFK